MPCATEVTYLGFARMLLDLFLPLSIFDLSGSGRVLRFTESGERACRVSRIVTTSPLPVAPEWWRLSLIASVGESTVAVVTTIYLHGITPLFFAAIHLR